MGVTQCKQKSRRKRKWLTQKCATAGVNTRFAAASNVPQPFPFLLLCPHLLNAAETSENYNLTDLIKPAPTPIARRLHRITLDSMFGFRGGVLNWFLINLQPSGLKLYLYLSPWRCGGWWFWKAFSYCRRAKFVFSWTNFKKIIILS